MMPMPRNSRTECCVGLVFSSSAAPRCGISVRWHEHHVLVADVVAHLADRFQERQRLDVADRSADFDDADVGAARFGDALDVRFDLVGDVRNDLNGRAEIVAAALLLDHRRCRFGRS